MAGSLRGLLFFEKCHAACELIKLCVLWMAVIQMPGVLLCDGSISGGILIVSAIGLNRMSLSVTRRPERAERVSHPSLGVCLKSYAFRDCAGLYQRALTQQTNRETTHRKVRTPADTHQQERGCLVCGFCVRWSWEGFDTSSESLGEETGDLTMWHRAFYRHRGK